MAVYKNDPNLQGLWLMEEASGTRADYTANNNDLTDNNTVGSSADAQEGSLSADFEASNSESLSIVDGSQTGLDLTGICTIVAWVKPESAGSDRAFVGKRATTGNQRSYLFQVRSTGVIDFLISSDGTSGTETRATAATDIGTGTWHHVAVVYNGTDIRLYLDGSLDSNGADNPKAYAGAIFDGTATFRIGAWGNTSTEHFDGLMDEVAVFNRPLSSTEIADIYNNGIQDTPSVTFNLTGVLDDFNRADATTLGANWLHPQPAGQALGYDGGISSNQAYNPDAGTSYPVYYTPAQYGPDCEAYFSMPTIPTGGTVTVGARITLVDAPAWTGYTGYVCTALRDPAGDDIFQMFRVDSGSTTQLGSTVYFELGSSSSIGIEIRGSEIKFFYKASGGSWTQIISATDSTYTSAGYLLMGFADSTTARYDDFGGGTVGGQPIMRRWGGIPGMNRYTGRRGW